MSIEDVKNTAESLKQKAEARSEDIEGTIEEKVGKLDNDPETIQAGQEKQEKAEHLRAEAEGK